MNKVLILFDRDDKPVGRWTLTDGPLPLVVLWNERAFSFLCDMAGGFRYRECHVVEIPYVELRKAPGLGPNVSA